MMTKIYFQLGMDHAHIHVYDSLLGTLPGDTKKQIASLLMIEEEKITRWAMESRWGLI